MMTTSPARILLADDEPLYLQTTAALLQRAGFDCQTTSHADGALQLLANQQFDLMLVDLNMPGNLDLELLRIGRRDYPEVPMVVVTGAPSLSSAIDSVRLQVADYLLKPVRIEELVASMRRVLSAQERASLHQKTSEIDHAPVLLGNSQAMNSVRDLIERAAGSDASVLITGESGTGKELAAQMLHQASRRRHAPFVAIDCTAIPESLFESVLFGHARGSFTGATSDQPGRLKRADGGTVFLDEIGELPLSSQSKLLRLIQNLTFTPVGQVHETSIDVRFIAATNRDLSVEMERGQFRRDLYYRLAVIPVFIPPLRARIEDTALLADYFLQKFRAGNPARPWGFSAEAMKHLMAYSWPGNVRELRNVVERTVTLADGRWVERRDLPENLQWKTSREDVEPRSPRDEILKNLERDYLEQLLRQHQGNVRQTANAAGMTRQGMYKLLHKHGIVLSKFRR